MSTYCSDMDLDNYPGDGSTYMDVAFDCFGRDVRLTVDGRTIYVSSADARLIAAALTRCAGEADAHRTPKEND